MNHCSLAAVQESYIKYYVSLEENQYEDSIKNLVAAYCCHRINESGLINVRNFQFMKASLQANQVCGKVHTSQPEMLLMVTRFPFPEVL